MDIELVVTGPYAMYIVSQLAGLGGAILWRSLFSIHQHRARLVQQPITQRKVVYISADRA